MLCFAISSTEALFYFVSYGVRLYNCWVRPCYACLLHDVTKKNQFTPNYRPPPTQLYLNTDFKVKRRDNSNRAETQTMFTQLATRVI